MIQLVEEGNTANTPTKKWVVDTLDEMNNQVPKDFATIVICLEDANFYICNGQGSFVKITK